MKRYVISLIALVFIVVPMLQAGWVVVQTTTEEDGFSETEKVYIQDNKIRNDLDEQTTVMNLESGELLLVNHPDKTYWQGEYSQMMQQSQNAAKQHMEDMMEEMTPEQREQYQQYMDQMDDAPMAAEEHETHEVEIAKKSTTDKIAGYSARLHDIYVDGEKVEELWISEDLPVLDEVDVEKLDQFMSQSMFGEAEDYNYEDSDAYRDLIKTGFPLKTVEYFEGEVGATTLVTDITEASLAESEFKAPAGYSEVTIQELWQK